MAPTSTKDQRTCSHHRLEISAEGSTMIRPFSVTLLALAALAAGGCSTPMSRAGLEPDVGAAIRDYYEAHATESSGGLCQAPYIDGITQTRVLDDDGERLTLEIRYLYRDWIKDRRDNGIRDCVDYGERRFVLQRHDDRVEVTEMTGPQRGGERAGAV
jgi:hypothetical protein